MIITHSVADVHCGKFIKCGLQQRAYFNLPVVGIAASYGVDGLGIDFRLGGASYIVGTGALAGGKRLRCGANHLPLLSLLGLCGLF